MPSFNSNTLLEELHNDVNALLTVTHTRIRPQPHAALLQQPQPGSWSVVQCLEHLNSYGYFYLPRLHEAISEGESKSLPAKPVFKSSWLGNYFTNLMKPKESGALRSKMQAPAGHRPVEQQDPETVIHAFISQQEQLLELLQRAQKVNIEKLRVATSLTSLLKLSAGDTFRFLIAHEQRHMLQALRAMIVASADSYTAVSMQSIAVNS